MVNVLVDRAEAKGVVWHPPTRECAVQFGHYGPHLVGREPLGKAWLLYAPSEAVLDELLDQVDGAVVALAAGALEQLGGDVAAVPTISGGWVARAAKGGEAAAKSATGKAEAVAVADMAKARRDKAAAIAAEVKPLEAAEAEPVEGELEPAKGGG